MQKITEIYKFVKIKQVWFNDKVDVFSVFYEVSIGLQILINFTTTFTKMSDILDEIIDGTLKKINF